MFVEEEREPRQRTFKQIEHHTHGDNQEEKSDEEEMNNIYWSSMTV